MNSSAAQLEETRAAFDSVATDYDGERGNNALIQEMRAELWRYLLAVFAPGSQLIDLGCGTGLDAVWLAQRGYRVTATDWSAAMLARTRERAAQQHMSARVLTCHLGAHELARLQGSYDGAYSDLGALNCVPDLQELAGQCARLLRPGGALVFSVIGRLCPWELGYYLAHGRWRRALVRYARHAVPVGLNGHTVWTRYYAPREFYRAFRPFFMLRHYRGICVFVPPPYLGGLRRAHPRWHERLWRLDRTVAGWPLLRGVGDHFLIVMQRR